MGWACILLAVVVVVVAGHLLPDVYVAMGTKVMHIYNAYIDHGLTASCSHMLVLINTVLGAH